MWLPPLVRHRNDQPRNVARMIANTLQRLQHERRLERDVEVAYVFHGAGQQAAHPVALLVVEILVPLYHHLGQLELQLIEGFHPEPQQVNGQLTEMPGIA